MPPHVPPLGNKRHAIPGGSFIQSTHLWRLWVLIALEAVVELE
jgi:hypothetical protein